VASVYDLSKKLKGTGVEDLRCVFRWHLGTW
jgi:hypothetical protein